MLLVGLACAAAAYGAGYGVEQMLEKMGVIEDGGHEHDVVNTNNESTAPLRLL